MKIVKATSKFEMFTTLVTSPFSAIRVATAHLEVDEEAQTVALVESRTNEPLFKATFKGDLNEAPEVIAGIQAELTTVT